MAKIRKGCIPLSTGMEVEKEEEAVINRGLETREAKKRRNGTVSERVPEGSRATGGSSTPGPWCTSGSRPDCGCATATSVRASARTTGRSKVVPPWRLDPEACLGHATSVASSRRQ